MTVTLALAGDTMLGRSVARTLATTPPEAVVAPEVRAAMGQADLVVLNLECCISERGEPWEAPGKPFFFRAPPRAVELLALLGTDCVTLANNHALDYGVDARATPGPPAAAASPTVGSWPYLYHGPPVCADRRGPGSRPGGHHTRPTSLRPTAPKAFADLGRQFPTAAELVRRPAPGRHPLVPPTGADMTAAPFATSAAAAHCWMRARP